MQNSSDRYPTQAVSEHRFQNKRLGGYLIEAGLITPAQVDVALNDQKVTGMRFGEILALRGWVKEQTIEYLMQKVVLPERQSSQAQPRPEGVKHQDTHPRLSSHSSADSTSSSSSSNTGQYLAESYRGSFKRKDLPITKPLPAVQASNDEDVIWVG